MAKWEALVTPSKYVSAAALARERNTSTSDSSNSMDLGSRDASLSVLVHADS